MTQKMLYQIRSGWNNGNDGNSSVDYEAIATDFSQVERFVKETYNLKGADYDNNGTWSKITFYDENGENPTDTTEEDDPNYVEDFVYIDEPTEYNPNDSSYHPLVDLTVDRSKEFVF